MTDQCEGNHADVLNEQLAIKRSSKDRSRSGSWRGQQEKMLAVNGSTSWVVSTVAAPMQPKKLYDIKHRDGH